MDSNDRNLGMGRRIARRDFVNGVAVAMGTTLLSGSAMTQENAPEQSPDYYPPALTGMRGSHPGSFEATYQLRDDKKLDRSGVSWTG